MGGCSSGKQMEQHPTAFMIIWFFLANVTYISLRRPGPEMMMGGCCCMALAILWKDGEFVGSHRGRDKCGMLDQALYFMLSSRM